jgi:putative ABC transport system substrate-binding protein
MGGGEAVELQHHIDIIGQHRDLDPAAQTAQTQCDYRLAQPGHGGDVAAFVKRHAHLQPLLTHWVSSRIVPRPKPCTGCLWLVGPEVKPGHGLTRVLPFGSPSGRRDQMAFCIGRREFITLLGGAAAMWPLVAHSQQRDQMRKIGVLYGGSTADPQGQSQLAAFAKGMRQLDWTPERNIAIEYRWAAGDVDRMRMLAKELVGLKPDLIIGHTTQVVASLQKETNTIPIVFVVVSDPVGSGFVASLPHPGGNITGFINVEGSLGGKWIELLKETIPGVARASVIFNPDTAPYWEYYYRQVETAARSVAIEPAAIQVGAPADIERAIASIAQVPHSGLLLIPDIFTSIKRNLDLIISLAARHRLATIYPYRYMTAAGGLMSYGIDNDDLWRRAATYVDRILNGAKPAQLPVQLPTKFELAINLKAAKALGLTMPPSLLARADEVIE